MSATVPDGYLHYPKQACLHAVETARGASIKVYHLAPADSPVSDAAQAAFDRWLAGDAAQIIEAGDMGFAIVHRCGEAFYFLLASVWREANELWEAVWYHDPATPDFAPFDPACPQQSGALRPTFCVWELAIIAHESQAWTRYLKSARGDDAARRWLEDCYSGVA